VDMERNMKKAIPIPVPNRIVELKICIVLVNMYKSI
jgi:hypothetical protein